MSKIKELLEEIARNTQPVPPDNDIILVALISASAVVVGSVITAVITYYVTNRTNRTQAENERLRLKADVVSRERLRWLQDLRLRLSKLYAQMDMQYVLLKQPLTIPQAEFQKQLDAFSMDIMEQVNTLTLMLNPEKSAQLNLRDTLQDALGFMQSCFQTSKAQQQSFNDAEYQRLKTNAFNTATEIGTKAWEKVQKLE